MGHVDARVDVADFSDTIALCLLDTVVCRLLSGRMSNGCLVPVLPPWPERLERAAPAEGVDLSGHSLACAPNLSTPKRVGIRVMSWRQVGGYGKVDEQLGWRVRMCEFSQ